MAGKKEALNGKKWPRLQVNKCGLAAFNMRPMQVCHKEFSPVRNSVKVNFISKHGSTKLRPYGEISDVCSRPLRNPYMHSVSKMKNF
jgi:hypothetical protein